MAEPHVLSALVSKRAEIAGEIEAMERQTDQLRADLLHIDAAIRIFDPDYRPNEIRPKAKRKKGEWFAHGELMRLVEKRVFSVLTRREGGLVEKVVYRAEEHGLAGAMTADLRTSAIQNTSVPLSKNSGESP